uniref:3-coathanger stack domain-containing protein n=1 Tax=Aquimarina megaterium TaxID=1443666 RepID=UPI000558EEA1
PGNSNPDVLVVGAMSPCAERKNPSSCDGENRWGSCYGTQLDIVAPGVKMPTTDRQGINGYSTSDYTQTFNGTSSACPVVAGVAALILSVNPNLTFGEVNTIIEQSAQKVGTYTYSTTGGRPNGTWNNQMGYGLVDAHQAVLLAQSCQDNLTINQNVLSGQTDIQEAKNTITATNVIFSGGTAAYDAGTWIHLKTGFSAKSGSSFRAYIEGCSGKGAVEQEPTSQQEVITYENISIENNALEVLEMVKVHPNPTKGIVTINSKKQIASWKLNDYMGRYAGKSKLKSNSSYKDQLNMSHLPAGLYVLKITLANGDTVYKNIVKN